MAREIGRHEPVRPHEVVAVVTRFRPRGMAMALGVAAVSTVVAGLWSLSLLVTDDVKASVGDVVMLTLMYAGLFALAACLFTRVRASGA